MATDRFDEDDPSEAQVAALCSPAFGIGADGFIRAVERDGVWFMDYRNADGSKAEMCGNGVRVSSTTCAARASWICPSARRWTWRREGALSG